MKMTYLKIIYIILIGNVLVSCGTQSELYHLYANSIYDMDVSLLISCSDSTYIYSQSIHSSNNDYKEIGRVRLLKDSIILIPACQVESDTNFYLCRYYDCHRGGYSSEGVDGKGVCIRERIYTRKNNTIKDCSLDKYFPNDSNGFSVYESFPLYERKIKRTRNEKGVLYSRKVLGEKIH